MEFVKAGRYKNGALSRFTLNPDHASMYFNDLLSEGKPKPYAFTVGVELNQMRPS